MPSRVVCPQRNLYALKGPVDYGLLTVDCGSWIVDCGLWIVDYGLWIMDCRFGIEGYGFWIVDYGLWVLTGLWILDKHILLWCFCMHAVWCCVAYDAWRLETSYFMVFLHAHVRKQRVVLCFLYPGGSKNALWEASGGTLEAISERPQNRVQKVSIF